MRRIKMKIPDNLIPLIYLALAAGIAIACIKLGVNEGITGMLVGAALTRVKKSSDGIIS